MSRMRNLFRAMFAMLGAMALIVTFTLVSPSHAEAATYPYGCSKQMTSALTAQAYCSGGSVLYRVAMPCKPVIGYAFTSYGNWVYPGTNNYSVARCPWGTYPWSPSGGQIYPWIEV